MTSPQSAVRRYVAFVVAVALLVGVVTLVAGPRAEERSVSTAVLTGALLVVGLILAARFPLRLTPKTKVHVDTAVLTIAALALDPWAAMGVVAAATAIHEAMRRQPRDQAIFNTAQTALHVGVGSIVFHLLAEQPIPPRFLEVGNVAAVLGCAAAMHAINSWTVATVGALEVGARPRRVWLSGIWLDAPEHVAQVAAGALVLAIARERPWVLPIVVVPAALIYVSMRRGVQVQAATQAAVEALASVVDLRDPTTAGHSERVALRARQLAERLRLPPPEVEAIAAAARVHDVGKVGLDPAVARKGGPLNAADWDQVRRHPVVGADLVEQFPGYAFGARDIRHHHERWDGSGFPDGIAGAAIPLGARIIGVVEAFDAMTHPTAYRSPLAAEAAVRELERGAGSQWDPDVAMAMVAIVREEMSAVRSPHGATRERPLPARGALAGADRSTAS